MRALFDSLPKEVVDLCWKVKKDFQPGRPNWDVFGPPIEEAEQAGHDPVAVKALWIGLEAFNAWRTDPARRKQQAELAEARDGLRYRRRDPFFGKLFAVARVQAYQFSDTGINQQQSLLLHGFMLHHEQTDYREFNWKPLFEGVAFLLRDDGNVDPYPAERIRLRLWRVEQQEKHHPDTASRVARRYFQAVYAISKRKRRSRTLIERRNRQ